MSGELSPDRRDEHSFTTMTPANDVFIVLDSGWHASCECGDTTVVESQQDGWHWVLNHSCALNQT